MMQQNPVSPPRLIGNAAAPENFPQNFQEKKSLSSMLSQHVIYSTIVSYYHSLPLKILSVFTSTHAYIVYLSISLIIKIVFLVPCPPHKKLESDKTLSTFMFS